MNARWCAPEELHDFLPSERDPLVTCGRCSLPEHNPIHHGNKQDVPQRRSLGRITERGEAACPGCGPGFRPLHNGSPRCESGSIASGGRNAHCTCDTCF